MLVDIETCSEEERQHWLIKRANIRNGGRPRENPLNANTVIDPESCKNADGQWTRFVRERLSEEELVAFERFNELCENHIITDHLSENHRMRFLYGSKFDVDSAFQVLLRSETIRYEMGCETLTGSTIAGFIFKAHAIVGRDRDGRAVVYSEPMHWNLGNLTSVQ